MLYKIHFLKISVYFDYELWPVKREIQGEAKRKEKESRDITKTGHTYLTVLRRKFQEQKDAENKEAQ